MGDLEQPRAEGALAAVAVEPVVGAQERVLRHVLGVLAAGHARHDAEHHVAMTLHEALEGPQVTVQRTPDKKIIGVV